MLPRIDGEFGVVGEPKLRFSAKGNGVFSARIVAKDRVRDQNGVWADGEPCFLDLVLFGMGAENAAESILSGDTIVVSGKLQMREWTNDQGEKRTSYQIVADSIGMSMKWNPAPSQKKDRATEKPQTAAEQNWGPENLTPPF